MSSKKRKAEVDKENWISSSFLAPLQGKIMFNWTNNRLGFPISLLSQLLRSGLNKFAEDALCPVVFTHGLAIVALKTICTKKSGISYVQTCNINLFFLSLVYSSTNQGKTGKSYTSVMHGLHTSQFLLCLTKMWFVHNVGSFIALISQSNAAGSRKNEPVWRSRHVLDAMFFTRGHKLLSLDPSLPLPLNVIWKKLLKCSAFTLMKFK